jgi:hypothetical protein
MSTYEQIAKPYYVQSLSLSTRPGVTYVVREAATGRQVYISSIERYARERCDLLNGDS